MYEMKVNSERKTVWSQNTHYPTITGKRPGEITTKSNVIHKSLKRSHDSSVNAMESIHKKDIRERERNRRALEKSMLAYTNKMREFSDLDNKRASDEQRAVKRQTVVTRRPLSLDKGLLAQKQKDDDLEMKITGSGVGGSESTGISKRPEVRAASEIIYRDKTETEKPLGPKTTGSLDLTVTNAFQHRAPRKISLSLPKSRVLSDSAYETDTDGDLDSEEGRANSLEISTFPQVNEDDRLTHRKMNEEAEKKSKATEKPLAFKTYLHWFKFTRKDIIKKEPVKMIKKKVVTKRKEPIVKPVKEIKVATPPREDKVLSRKDSMRNMKFIHSFRYSYAVEDYFKKRSKRRRSEDSDFFMNEEEVINGWVVKPLGAKVLHVDDERKLLTRRGTAASRLTIPKYSPYGGSSLSSIKSNSHISVNSTSEEVSQKSRSHQETEKDNFPNTADTADVIHTYAHTHANMHLNKSTTQDATSKGRHAQTQTILPEIRITGHVTNAKDKVEQWRTQPTVHKQSHVYLPVVSVES